MEKSAASEPVTLRQFSISLDDIEKLPKWDPWTKEAPPVSISKAIAVALPKIRAAAKGWPWRIRTVTLTNGSGDIGKSIWFYEVSASIEAYEDSNRKPARLYVLTLLDGRTLVSDVDVSSNPGPAAPDPVVQPHERFAKANKIVVSRTGLQSGEDYVYELTKEEALKLPDWYGESGTPIPLETKDVLAHLRILIGDRIPGHEWELQSFRLMCGGKGGVVPFETRHLSYYSIAVLHRPEGSGQEKMYWKILGCVRKPQFSIQSQIEARVTRSKNRVASFSYRVATARFSLMRWKKFSTWYAAQKYSTPANYILLEVERGEPRE